MSVLQAPPVPTQSKIDLKEIREPLE